MKILIVLLSIACSALANTCTVTVDQITHGSARFQIVNDDATTSAQVQWGLAAGVYGFTQGDDGGGEGVIAGGTRWLTVTGFPAATTIHFAPQSFNGSAYCPAVDHTFATSSNPAHPVMPTGPTTYSVAAPTPATGRVIMVNSTGATCSSIPTWQTLYGDGSATCVDVADFQTALGSSPAVASAANATFSDTIILASDTTNTGTLVSFDASANSTMIVFPDAPDSAKIDSFVAATGVFTSHVAHGLSTGQQIILGGNSTSWSTFQQNNEAPLPFNGGFPYFVKSTPSSTTFTLSQTNGGATILGLSGSNLGGPVYGCFIVSNGTDIPPRRDILIRTSTPDLLLSPFGVSVFTDANLSVQNPGYFASIVNATTGSDRRTAGFRQDVGCLAHNYRYYGIKFAYAPLGTTNEYDGPNYAGYMAMVPANYHITFDRSWVHGGDYPERNWKWCGGGSYYCDGHYLSIIDSVIDNLNFWTPSWSATPFVRTSGTVITIPPGKFFFGNGAADNLNAASGGALTITSGGGVSGHGAFEVTRSGFFLTMPTGMSATCVIAGQTCTVGNDPTPNYLVNGSGYYSRVAVALPTISGGAWTGTGENSPQNLSNGVGSASQEGATAIFVNRGPGPFLERGNIWHNIPGITHYWPGDYSGYVQPSGTCLAAGLSGCPWLNIPGDLVFLRNAMKIDQDFIADETSGLWNGRFYSHRQLWELKVGQRNQVVGNRFSGTFCNNFSGKGVFIALSNVGGPTTTVSDTDIGYNSFAKGCQGIQILGNFTVSTPGSAQIVSQRTRLHGNTWTQINRNKYATFNTSGAGGDNGYTFQLTTGPIDLTIENETVDVNQGPGPANAIVSRLLEGLTLRNSIIGFSNDDGQDGFWYAASGSTPTYSAERGSVLMPHVVPANFLWDSVAMFGGYSSGSTQMNSSDIATQATIWTGLTNTTVPAGNTIAARAAFIGFTSYDASIPGFINPKLLVSSPYHNAGTDGKDLGADIDAQCVQQGCVTGVSASAITGTSELISFTAPDTVGCPVDYGTDSTLVTWTGRKPNAGGARAQSAPLSSLIATTVYYYRVDCEVEHPTGTFTTGAAAPVSGGVSSVRVGAAGVVH